MFPIDRSSIDKSLPVPVGRQLYGLLAYAISHGDVRDGERLPSVRDMAEHVGLATMTVNKVYKDLCDAGLLTVRRGLGAFVSRATDAFVQPQPEMDELRALVDDVVAKATDLAMPRDALIAMINTQMQVRRLHAGLRLVFVGVFDAPTRDYVEEIRPFLSAEDRIDTTTLDALRGDAGLRRRCGEADAVLTFLHRQAEVEKIVPEARLVGLRFIPSEATRLALAGLDPRDRIAAVTRFEEYIAIMKPSIRQFAPHVSDIHVTYSDAPDLARALADRDVVVYATGADAVTALLQPGTRCFEYRHSPHPGELARLLVPYLARLRTARAADAVTPDEGPSIRRRPAPRDRRVAGATSR